MYDSKVKAADLIEQIKTETDISLPISNGTYAEWLSETEQMLYSSFIKDIYSASVGLSGTAGADGVSRVSLSGVTPSHCEQLRFEDILEVYCGDKALMKVSPIIGFEVPDTWFRYRNNSTGDENMFCHISDKSVHAVKIIYRMRPKIKKYASDGSLDETVKVPFEFLELVKAKLRGEAYKLANEDTLAAKWLNDYNAHLQDFQLWLKKSDAAFGTYGW